MSSYLYILTNHNHTVLYIGVTSDLDKRLWQHRTNLYHTSFTSKYQCYKCIYIEEYVDIRDAIAREKQLKKWSRYGKEQLITKQNPTWEERIPFLPQHEQTDGQGG